MNESLLCKRESEVPDRIMFSPDLGVEPGEHGFTSELVLYRRVHDNEEAEVWFYDEETGIEWDGNMLSHEDANWFEEEVSREMTRVYDGVYVPSGTMYTHYVMGGQL